MPINTSKSIISLPFQRMYSCFLLTSSSSHWTKVPDSQNSQPSSLCFCPAHTHLPILLQMNSKLQPGQPSYCFPCLWFFSSTMTLPQMLFGPPTPTHSPAWRPWTPWTWTQNLELQLPIGCHGNKTNSDFIDLIKGNSMQRVPGQRRPHPQETLPPLFLHLPKPWPS